MEKEWIECWCALYTPPPIWVTGVQFPKLFPPHYPYGAFSVRDINILALIFSHHVHKKRTHLLPTLHLVTPC